MPATKQPGYHFAHNTEGALAIEADQPYAGAVTVTWRPHDYPGSAAEVVMPQELFAKVALNYVTELANAKKK